MKKKINIKNICIVIVSILCVLFSIISLIFISLIGIFRKNININDIDSFIVDYKIAENINIDSSFITNILNDLLVDTDISEESISKFINSEEIHEFENEIINSIIGDIFKGKEIDFEFNNEKIEKLLYDNIPELSDRINNKIYNKIQSKIPNVVHRLNELLDDFKDKINSSEKVILIKNYIIKSVNLFDYLLIICNVILIVLVITLLLSIILMRNKMYNGLSYMGIAFLYSSVILCVINKMIKDRLNLPLKINNCFKEYILMYLIVGIIFFIAYLIIRINKKRKNRIS